MRRALIIAFCTLTPYFPSLCADLSAIDIVRRATTRENDNLALRLQYTYRETANEKRLSKKGEVESDHQTVHEVFYIGGEQYRKLVSKDGRPLSDKDAEREQNKLDKQIEKRKNESPSEATKRQEKDLREAREFRDQILEAYDFRIVGEEDVDGRPCYRIHADPKPGFRPRGDGKILRKIRGDLWIDKDNFKWARVEAESIDTIPGMGGLIRIAKGSTINITQTFVNNEVWFPDRMVVRANAKALLFLSAAIEFEARFSDFRKFTVDSKVVAAEPSAVNSASRDNVP